MIEQDWREIRGYEGRYQCNNMGKIRSTPENKARPTITLKQSVSPFGYMLVALRSKTHRVHRLVGLSWIENPHNHPVINHKDGNKKNNAVSNLEWCTYSENNQHAFDSGLSVGLVRAGGTNPNASPVSQYGLNGNFITTWESMSKAVSALGVNQASISQCCAGKIRSARGFQWRKASESTEDIEPARTSLRGQRTDLLRKSVGYMPASLGPILEKHSGK